MTCAVCAHPQHCHAGKTKQDDAYGSPLCIRCHNEGDRNRAAHTFVAAKPVLAHE